MAKQKTGKMLTWILCVVASICVIVTTSMGIASKVKEKNNEESTETARIESVLES